MAHSIKLRIMYIECKGGGFVEMYGQLVADHEASLTGPARIGRVTFNRTGNTLFYDGKRFHRSEGFKSNYVCEETGSATGSRDPKTRRGCTVLDKHNDKDRRRCSRRMLDTH
jgi:hypothetical protein